MQKPNVMQKQKQIAPHTILIHYLLEKCIFVLLPAVLLESNGMLKIYMSLLHMEPI